MAYWVHGRDAKTGRPDSMLTMANTPDEAREQAAAQGLIAETIQLEHDPNVETIPLPFARLPLAFRLRYKIIAIVLFIFGYSVVGFFWSQHLKNDLMGYFEGFSCLLFTLAFFAWGLGCVFQSRTWKGFKLGCLIGMIMFWTVMFSLFISIMATSHR